MDLTAYSSKYIIPTSKIIRYFKSFSLTLLFVLAAIDFIFMGLHAMKSLGYITDPNFSVTQSWGYPEIFQYLKAGFVAACFFWLGANYKRPQFYSWGVVFLYVLLDDSIEVHEYLGYHAGTFLENAGISGGKTLGELVVFGLLGLMVFTPLFYFYIRSRHRELKIMTQDLFMLFVAMLFFGIGVDVLHDMAETGTVLNGVLGLVEDGGEMLVMSIITWYTWTMIKHDNILNRLKRDESYSEGHKKQKDRAAVSNPKREAAKNKAPILKITKN